jgi:hypothetical protein
VLMSMAVHDSALETKSAEESQPKL